MGLESVNVEDLGFEEGDTVIVISGPFAESTGLVKETTTVSKLLLL